jgi:hypothetical protein
MFQGDQASDLSVRRGARSGKEQRVDLSTDIRMSPGRSNVSPWRSNVSRSFQRRRTRHRLKGQGRERYNPGPSCRGGAPRPSPGRPTSRTAKKRQEAPRTYRAGVPQVTSGIRPLTSRSLPSPGCPDKGEVPGSIPGSPTSTSEGVSAAQGQGTRLPPVLGPPDRRRRPAGHAEATIPVVQPCAVAHLRPRQGEHRRERSSRPRGRRLWGLCREGSQQIRRCCQGRG